MKRYAPTALVLALAVGLTGCDININVGTGESSTSTATTTTTATTTPTTPETQIKPPPPTPAAAPAIFHSPTGNIGCAMATDGVRCDITDHTWQAPPKPASCPTDWGNGLSVGLRGTAKFVCAGDTVLGAGFVLRYGKFMRLGRFVCASSSDGMRCANRDTRHGFLISRDQARNF